MNRQTELWWRQAQSDHEMFLLLRQQGVAQCHVLHYLQMVTEKLAKAYFWRSGSPPPRSHAGFVQFMRFLGQVPFGHRPRVAQLFGFARFDDFQKWIRLGLPLAYELERLSPDLANQGPNPEYPWPHVQPHSCPVEYNFPIWASLKTGRGRDLMRILKTAVDHFDEYADL